MALRLHNTLTRSLEPFEPLEEGHVRYYTCGPTVYDRAHIGNFRTFVWEDLLRRYLEWKGYRVTQVMNLTDVDDKTIREALERGVSLQEVTDPVTEMFFEDWETLGLEDVEATPRATETVDAMIRLVEKLEEAGLTYESDGSVYFSISEYEDYGQLVELDPEQLESAGRAESDEVYEKDDPRDFVLWKGGDRDDEGEVATWDSPWGPGRPGWHLECSVMALEELGPTIDIHAGGVDLIFPHHENEIAQAEGATGEPFVRFWLHAKHLLVEGEKMSKSLGNFYTIPDLLEKGYRGSAIRYLLLSGHYRSELNFTLDGLDEAERALDRLEEFRRRVREAEVDADAADGPAGELPELAREARRGFEAAMDDDLNVSDARGAIFELVRQGNGRLDGSGERLTADARDAVLAVLQDFDRVFGVLSLRDRERSSIPTELRRWVEERLEARSAARERGDYEEADAIRDEIEARGIQLEDAPDGTTRWKLREGEFAAVGS
ncbi:MAG: cysteine--tRNA ligase [Candidatus Palauibacterales bacterium]|nr:cysteine--tRNA ligase [Candidatus Palauibacterales bacterium]